MDFKQWLEEECEGIGQATAVKYYNALSRYLSNLAIELNFCECKLLKITNLNDFKNIFIKIQNSNEFIEKDTTGNGMYSAALKKYEKFLKSYVTHLDDDLLSILKDKSIQGTEREAQVKARIGQGEFKKKLVEYWKGCAVTGYKDVSLTVASHIKPWARSSPEERLNLFSRA
ncbi:MAG: hypothetical protein ACNI3A_18905 [Desulfovibrio sp.]|uniref:hypothetical protein n=1 Tax=Desulfovibrio sp. 7SRBS1 TaxID=3378064 RepID=UPI003B411EA3